MPMEEITKLLLVYGPLGVFCVVALVFAKQKDKALTDFTKEKDKEISELRREHNEEMRIMQERLITRTETQLAKYQELAVGLHAVVNELKR